MSHQSTLPKEADGNEVVALQKALQNTQNELQLNHQKSADLTDINGEIQQQLQEQYAINDTLTANVIDLEMKIDALEAHNQEYQHTIHQTNDKYEDAMHELSLIREQLNVATHRLKDNEHTMQSLNNDLLHIANTPIKHDQNNYKFENAHLSNNNSDYKQQYDELLKECEQHRTYYSQSIEQQIEVEKIKKDSIELKQKNKQLNEQIVELTCSNVHLEKEINDYSQKINKQNELLNYLQTENQKLSTQFTEQLTPPKNAKITLNSPNFSSEMFSILKTGIKDEFYKFNSVNSSNNRDHEDENDLFTMVENYNHNGDEYLKEIDEKYSEELHIVPVHEINDGEVSLRNVYISSLIFIIISAGLVTGLFEDIGIYLARICMGMWLSTHGFADWDFANSIQDIVDLWKG